eukprot:6872381-Pyramimonas_sp.AAC.1
MCIRDRGDVSGPNLLCQAAMSVTNQIDPQKRTRANLKAQVPARALPASRRILRLLQPPASCLTLTAAAPTLRLLESLLNWPPD